MTSKLIDKLTKFCFHSPSPTTPASLTPNPSKPHPQPQQASPTTPANHNHNTSKSNPQPLSASPPTPLRIERGVITEIDLSLGITKPNSIAFTTKFCLYFTPSLYLSLCHSVSKKHSVFLCPYVILSLKKHSVIICLYVILSLKKHSVFTRPYFILSLKKHSAIICLYVILSLKKICLYSSLCYSVS